MKHTEIQRTGSKSIRWHDAGNRTRRVETSRITRKRIYFQAQEGI
jgi:hypothetical protein